MSKKLTIRFYRITCPDAVEFPALLKKIKRSSVKDRTHKINKIPIRAMNLSSDDAFFYGDLIKIRMDELPQIANSQNDELKDLTITADEGLGEAAAFLYHPETNIIAMQFNSHGVREGVFVRYLKHFYKHQEFCELRPILKDDTVEKYNRLKLFTKMQIKLAQGLTSNSTAKNPSVSHVLNLVKLHDSPTIDLTLSLGHGKKGRSLRDIKSFIDSIRSGIGSFFDVKKLQVEGKESIGLETEVVDFIQDLLKYEATIQANQNRTYSYTKRKKALLKAWDKHGPGLIERFNNP